MPSTAKERAARINGVQQRLIHWAARQEALQAQYEALKAVTGADIESPFMTAVFDLWDAYTVAISAEVGDTNEWLDWYEFECQMGAHPMQVEIGSRTINVRTLKQLATVICS